MTVQTWPAASSPFTRQLGADKIASIGPSDRQRVGVLQMVINYGAFADGRPDDFVAARADGTEQVGERIALDE